MLIGVCGYGFTGSGAVVDLLNEYSEPQVFRQAEIQETFKIDGLQDLEYHLVKQYSRHISGDAAIKRFKEVRGFYSTPILKKTVNKKDYFKISDEYLSGLIQAEWFGVDNIDYSSSNGIYNFIVLVLKKKWFPLYERITGKDFKHWPARKMYLSIEPEDFYEKTKEYTDKLMMAMGADLNRDIVLDQVFEGNRPQNSFPFFRNPKAIVVDRDPRDVFMLARYGKKTAAEARFMPRMDVDAFIKYYQKLRLHTEDDSEYILHIKFEDLIYEYDSTIEKIERFTGYKDHYRKQMYFKPEISICNTQIFKNPLYEKDIELVKTIEKAMPEFLYDFDKYNALKSFNRAF